jgi:hypothetical protein
LKEDGSDDEDSRDVSPYYNLKEIAIDDDTLNEKEEEEEEEEEEIDCVLDIPLLQKKRNSFWEITAALQRQHNNTQLLDIFGTTLGYIILGSIVLIPFGCFLCII